MTNYLVYLIPLLVSTVNYIAKVILRALSYAEKSQTVTDAIYRSAINMMVIATINIGVVIMIVNFDYGLESPIPLFQGSYRRFSVQWYRLVGSSICLQMLLMVFSTNLCNLAFQVMYACLRFKDRGWKASARNTQSLSQEDYEDVNIGADPSMDYKYANMLTVLMITMMYGGGIPILYPIAMLYCFVTYWTDKLLIFRYYRKPEFLDHTLPADSLKWYKVAFLLHIVVSCMMFSNVAVLPSKVIGISTKFGIWIRKYFDISQFGSQASVQMSIYAGILLSVVLIYILYKLFHFSIAAIFSKNCFNLQKRVHNRVVNDDFLQCISFTTLKRLMKESEGESKKLKKFG